jgi:hypothetical protein
VADGKRQNCFSNLLHNGANGSWAKKSNFTCPCHHAMPPPNSGNKFLSVGDKIVGVSTWYFLNLRDLYICTIRIYVIDHVFFVFFGIGLGYRMIIDLDHLDGEVDPDESLLLTLDTDDFDDVVKVIEAFRFGMAPSERSGRLPDSLELSDVDDILEDLALFSLRSDDDGLDLPDDEL